MNRSLDLFILAYYFMLNIVTFSAMGIDKFKAWRNKWRIPETTLIILSSIGGVLGMILAMLVFRHKIRKRVFITTSVLFSVMHMIILYKYFIQY